MPFQTTSVMKPKKNSLVVCAGTVLIHEVERMGAGFSLFKKLFKSNQSCNTKGGWKAELQQKLDDFFDSKKPMPAYMRIAKQGTLLGGVAMVPMRDAWTGLNHETFETPEEHNEKQKAQYKSAVKAAILDAKTLKRPLFLQPLGIDAYGWKPEEAAILFAEAIREADPTDEVDITIPIYLASLTSNDQLFKTALITEMAKKANFILSTIIDTLISNIETKSGGRYTSGLNSKKVIKLKTIKQSLNQHADLSAESDEYKRHLQMIMDICKIKRNPLHFWGSPHSVNEYLLLLKENRIEFKETISHQTKYKKD